MNHIIKNPKKIGCFVQSGTYKTIDSAKTAAGATAICNFQMFNFQTQKPSYVLKVDGKVLGNDGANYYGYAWNKNDRSLTFTTASEMSKFDNFAGCVLVAKDGKAIAKPAYPAEIGGTRGRTCIGLRADGSIVIYCWKDGSTGACTMEKLGGKMIALGCVNAVAYDGGGSCMCRTSSGNVSNSRPIQNFLYFVEDAVEFNSLTDLGEPTTLIKSGSTGIGAKWVQDKLNKHGASLDIDGQFGAQSVAALKAFQKAHGLTADGVCGAATRAELKKDPVKQTVVLSAENCPYSEPSTTLRSGNRGDGVRWLQWYLRKHGYTIEPDGEFGPATLAALKQFQQSRSLTVDGICGAATRSALKSQPKVINSKSLAAQKEAIINYCERQVDSLYVYGSQGQTTVETVDWSAKCFPKYTTAERAKRMKNFLAANKKLANGEPVRMHDCSGLIWAGIAEAQFEVMDGKHITDSTAADLYNRYCTPVKKSDLKPGDLVFTAGLDHVAIVGHDNHIIECAGSDVGCVLNKTVDDRKVRSVYYPKYNSQEFYTKSPWTLFGRFKRFKEAGL